VYEFDLFHLLELFPICQPEVRCFMRLAFDGHYYDYTVLWNATPCNLPESYTHFKGTYCFHFQTCQCIQQRVKSQKVAFVSMFRLSIRCLYFVDRASRYKFLEITNLTHFFVYLFISCLYMFRASQRSRDKAKSRLNHHYHASVCFFRWVLIFLEQGMSPQGNNHL